MVQEDPVDLELSSVEPQRGGQDYAEHYRQYTESQLEFGEQVGWVHQQAYSQGDQQEAASDDSEVVHEPREQLHQGDEEESNGQSTKESELDLAEGIEDALSALEAGSLEELLLEFLVGGHAVLSERR